MHPIRDYFKDAKENEEIFRSILKSFSKKFLESISLNPDDSLKEIFETCSKGNRYGKWTILDFRRGPYEDSLLKLSENEAMLATENIATLSGFGRIDKYQINTDNSADFNSNITYWMS